MQENSFKYQNKDEYKHSSKQQSFILWLYRVLFILGLFFIMSVYKILYFVVGDVMPFAITEKLLLSLFCFGGISIIVLIIVLHTILKIATESKKFKISEKPIDYEVPITWIIPRIVGWVYVDKHTQVAIIGKKKYRRSALFFTSPFSIERQVVISTRKIPYEVQAKTHTQSGQILDIKVAGYYQVNVNRADKLISEIEDVAGYFQSTARNILTNFAQTVPVSVIYNNEKEASRLLERMLEKEMLYFHVTVDSLNVMGKMVEDEDEKSRIHNIIKLEILKSYPKMLESTADKIADAMIKKYLMEDIGQGKHIESRLLGLLKMLQNTFSTMPVESKSSDFAKEIISTKTLPSRGISEAELNRAISGSSFRRIDNGRPPYTLEYKGYIVTIEPEVDDSLLVTLLEPTGRRRRPVSWKKTLGELLSVLQKAIDQASSRH